MAELTHEELNAMRIHAEWAARHGELGDVIQRLLGEVARLEAERGREAFARRVAEARVVQLEGELAVVQRDLDACRAAHAESEELVRIYHPPPLEAEGCG